MQLSKYKSNAHAVSCLGMRLAKPMDSFSVDLHKRTDCFIWKAKEAKKTFVHLLKLAGIHNKQMEYVAIATKQP